MTEPLKIAQEALELSARTAPAPWHVKSGLVTYFNGEASIWVAEADEDRDEAAFIAFARNNIEPLATALIEAEKERDDLRREVANLEAGIDAQDTVLTNQINRNANIAKKAQAELALAQNSVALLTEVVQDVAKLPLLFTQVEIHELVGKARHRLMVLEGDS